MNYQNIMSIDLPFNPSLFSIQIEKYSNKYSINIINNEEQKIKELEFQKQVKYERQFLSSYCTLYEKKDGSIYKKNTCNVPDIRNFDSKHSNSYSIYKGYENSYGHKVIDYYIEFQLNIDFLTNK